ncbi:diguanylate cyclase [Myxococcus sp. CA033]|uniref:diguanylate cyclase domain-containing protein n=1 Tax=Myxococcus sp. CA033 TaxID=2741516 RepID=UPI00157A89DA|nr:diguanylate cyclase [Myxococcus sp. CA033]NTX36896.1 diguanylate cyclase [Myxococcus sp. CA033]
MARYALIAEPDPHRAAGLLALVAGEGLEGVLARDGAEAQEVVRQRSAPALLLTDLALPRVDGFTLLTWLRERQDAEGTQVVVVTAFDELRVRAWQLKDALGIHSLLSRRAPAETVRDTVRRVLAGQRPLPPTPTENTPDEEHQRLARIEAMRLVDEGPPEAELQELVTEVAQAFAVPVALLTLVLGDRQWFKAHVGLPHALARDRGTPRDWAFCHHVVMGRESLVVPDATRHPVFRDNPLVRDGIVGSYAGAPLVTPGGEVLGTLCVIDTRPLVLGTEDLAALRELARRVAGDLELRSRARMEARDLGRSRQEPSRSEVAALAQIRDAIQALDVATLLVAPGRQPFAGNAALSEMLGLPLEGIPKLTFDDFRQHVAKLTADPSGRSLLLDLASESSRGLHLTLALEHPRPRRIRWVARPFPIPGGTAQLLTLSELGGVSPKDERERMLRVDPLTGLATRRVGEERLLREIGRCRRDGVPCGVLLVDLVGLGRLNLRHGFDAGDNALRDVARRLEDVGVPSGFAVRWEGGTLLVALPGQDARATEALRAQLHEELESFEFHGAAVAVEGEEDPRETLARAHAALSRAKADHRARTRTG